MDGDVDLVHASDTRTEVFAALTTNFGIIVPLRGTPEPAVRAIRSLAAWRTVATACVTDPRLENLIIGSIDNRRRLNDIIKGFSHVENVSPPDETAAFVYITFRLERLVRDFLGAAYEVRMDDLFVRAAAAATARREAPSENRHGRPRRRVGDRGPPHRVGATTCRPEKDTRV